MSEAQIAVVQLVGRGGLVVADHVANRVFREEHEELLHARKRSDAALRRLVLKGYLEARPVALRLTEASTGVDLARVVGDTYFTQAYSVTQKARLEFDVPLPPTLREGFVDHHVRTMEAIYQAEKDLEAEGYEIVGWKTESQLIREKFRGVVFDSATENVIPKFPDAMLFVRGADGVEEAINVEYVSAKYTDEMIRQKHARFTGRTIWAAPNASTAGRIERITGSAAFRV